MQGRLRIDDDTRPPASLNVGHNERGNFAVFAKEIRSLQDCPSEYFPARSGK